MDNIKRDEQGKINSKVLDGETIIRFAEMCRLVEAFGFKLDRITGSHQIYVHPNVQELMNLQEVKGKAKPYQI